MKNMNIDISGNTQKEWIRNEEIRLKIGVAATNENTSHLSWFDHVQRKVANVQVRKNELIQVEGIKKVKKDKKLHQKISKKRHVN